MKCTDDEQAKECAQEIYIGPTIGMLSAMSQLPAAGLEHNVNQKQAANKRAALVTSAAPSAHFALGGRPTSTRLSGEQPASALLVGKPASDPN
jgi:hypothetical protein